MQSQEGESSDSLEVLRPERNRGYLKTPLPKQRDTDISELVGSGGPDLSRVGRTHDHHPVLRVFAERMASWAVRTGDLETLKTGLVALSLAGLGESRDTLTILPLFLHAAKKLGFDPVALFREAAQTASPAAAEVLEGFLRREAEDQTLEAMGYREGRDADGFRYERTW